jgi:hypothetical protein
MLPVPLAQPGAPPGRNPLDDQQDDHWLNRSRLCNDGFHDELLAPSESIGRGKPNGARSIGALYDQRRCEDQMLGIQDRVGIGEVLRESRDIPPFVLEARSSGREKGTVILVDYRVIQGIVWITSHVAIRILSIDVRIRASAIGQLQEAVIDGSRSVPRGCLQAVTISYDRSGARAGYRLRVCRIGVTQAQSQHESWSYGRAQLEIESLTNCCAQVSDKGEAAGGEKDKALNFAPVGVKRARIPLQPT